MKKCSLLFLLLLSLVCARTYTLRVDDTLRGDYFYTLATMLEGIPELDVRVFDGTDTDLHRLGVSGRDRHTIALFVNKVKVMDFQDGSFVDALRPFTNNSIDSIVVYTGPDACHFQGNYATVISIITKRNRNPFFDGMTYVGSEIGDPAIYLYLLEGEKPYNKEQLASGELFGGFKTRNLMHQLGYVMTYVDRYSNGHEEERSKVYGKKNTLSSQCEVRKGTYDIFHTKSANLDWNLTAFAGDYNLFRYYQPLERYFYYEGRRASLQGGSTCKGKHSSWSVALSGTYESSDVYNTGTTYSSADWGAISFNSSLILPKGFSLSLSGEQEFGQRGLATLTNEVPPFKEEIQVMASKFFLDSLLEVSLSYPPKVVLQAQYKSTVTLQGALSSALLEDVEDTIRGAVAGDLSCIVPLNDYSSLAVSSGAEVVPQWIRISDKKFSQYKKGVWAELSYDLKKYATCSFYASNYLFKGRLSSTFKVRGLYFFGALDVRSKSYWDTARGQLAFSQKDESDQTLNAHVKGTIRMSYALFNNHLRVAVAVRDIGKVVRDVPNGSMVGPVIVSNIHFRF